MSNKDKKFSTLPTADKALFFVERLTDKKAGSIVAFDLSKENSMSEAVVIANATSIRHAQGLADHLLQAAKDEHFEFLNMEGHSVGRWILLDFNDVIVHIFQPDSRDLFRLDDLWNRAPLLADTRVYL
ncbi:ribosome silencing factor [Desulfovibrio sp. OttesenSCG-928-M14]|nr:ribosome silencing factor [Desulfovibrio sp. OttesenSCG-928-M14]